MFTCNELERATKKLKHCNFNEENDDSQAMEQMDMAMNGNLSPLGFVGKWGIPACYCHSKLTSGWALGHILRTAKTELTQMTWLPPRTVHRNTRNNDHLGSAVNTKKTQHPKWHERYDLSTTPRIIPVTISATGQMIHLSKSLGDLP